MQSTVVSDIVGVANISRAQAFVLVATGVGALIGVPLAGKHLSSYLPAIDTSGGEATPTDLLKTSHRLANQRS